MPSYSMTDKRLRAAELIVCKKALMFRDCISSVRTYFTGREFVCRRVHSLAACPKSIWPSWNCSRERMRTAEKWRMSPPWAWTVREKEELGMRKSDHTTQYSKRRLKMKRGGWDHCIGSQEHCPANSFCKLSCGPCHQNTLNLGSIL